MSHYPKAKALDTHKRQVQEAYNFAVFACHAAPHFEQLISAVEAGTNRFPKPFYFTQNQNSPAFFRTELANFEKRLSSYAFFSVFSYFEAFVHDVVQEMIDYHGGQEAMIKLAIARDKKLTDAFASLPGAKNKLKLRKFVKSKVEKYKKFSAILDEAGFRFPTERFSSYGIRMLVERHKNLKSVQIPTFLNEALHMTLDKKDVDLFQTLRDKRNKLAHGKSTTMNMKELGRANDLFRRWTFAINTHILDNFFVIEQYAI